MINLSYEILESISKKYGDSFYILDEVLFEKNYWDMLNAFRKYYSNTHIAYSYKTNYTPSLCSIINKNGGYAEVVSEMEMWLALKLGVEPSNIYYNGPYKKKSDIEKLLLLGGHINCDSYYEVEIIKEIAKKYESNNFTVGLRCNLFIGGETISRFGFDTESGELYSVIDEINKLSNVKVIGLHSHLPYRTLESFEQRVQCVKTILNELGDYALEYISVGGGYMGKVNEDMAQEFAFTPPTYEQYAEIVAKEMNILFGEMSKKPKLIIEPGSALVANTMKYVTRVLNIKKIKGKSIASMTGSTYCINPSVKNVKRPIQVYIDKEEVSFYENLDMAGYTCIEADYLYKGYCGKLSPGSFCVFDNVGSYSIVMKPPFILPEVAVLGFKDNKELIEYKRAQAMEEVYKLFYMTEESVDADKRNS